jgi:NAD(P)-dependent dehydrogenase (short-subunit alcohol dehydrogenase family)
MSKPIALILGSGANLGSHVASRFRSDGYRVATVSRSKSAEKDEESSLALTCDLADPKEVETVFATVRKTWGEPSVVVYNGMVYPCSVSVEANSLVFVAIADTSRHSILPHQQPNPRVCFRSFDARLRAPPRCQHDVCFCRGSRGFEQFRKAGSREFLLHGKLPALELSFETHDAGSGQDG